MRALDLSLGIVIGLTAGGLLCNATDHTVRPMPVVTGTAVYVEDCMRVRAAPKLTASNKEWLAK